MIHILKARWHQKMRTIGYPATPAVLPDRFRGAPVLGSDHETALRSAMPQCPVGAIKERDGKPVMDLGRCLFCGSCERACGGKGLQFGSSPELAVTRRQDLVVGEGHALEWHEPAKAIRKLFGRSLKLRQVSAGGCNACEADVNVLNTVVFDLGRFGIQFVASPRHADGLLITGPVPENMRLALEKTYAAVPEPRIVIAVGSCAISGGPYEGHPETHSGASSIVPVDLFIPGCPPHPITILNGLLRYLGRMK